MGAHSVMYNIWPFLEGRRKAQKELDFVSIRREWLDLGMKGRSLTKLFIMTQQSFKAYDKKNENSKVELVLVTKKFLALETSVQVQVYSPIINKWNSSRQLSKVLQHKRITSAAHPFPMIILIHHISRFTQQLQPCTQLIHSHRQVPLEFMVVFYQRRKRGAKCI